MKIKSRGRQPDHWIESNRPSPSSGADACTFAGAGVWQSARWFGYSRSNWLLVWCLLYCLTAQAQEGQPAATKDTNDAQVAELAREVHGKGWIVFSAKTEAGDWDLFLMRPDGSGKKNITQTPNFSEAAARFSPDGKRILYYRLPKGEILDNNKYGLYDLVIANSDGTKPVVYGNGFSWASWSGDGAQIVSLSKSGIRWIDLATKKVLRTLERKGLVEQLFISPDGRWLCGTANGLGEHWAIGRMNAQTGELNRVSDGDCFNCTSDWFPDSAHIIYSKGHPRTEGWAQLWMANGDGSEKHMLYGEIDRHIYGGAVSPDGGYLLFTRSREDLGTVDNSFTTMALMRLKDAPIVGGKSEVLRRQYPQAKPGPVLDLSSGWEPHWTSARLD
jgi:dipeptidyl aminopeptidase/acylaminoacyl peptidase